MCSHVNVWAYFLFAKIAIHWQLGADGMGYGLSVSMTQLSWDRFAVPIFKFWNHLINLNVLQWEKRAACLRPTTLYAFDLMNAVSQEYLEQISSAVGSNVHRIWPSVFNIKSRRDLTKHSLLKAQLWNVTEFQTRPIEKKWWDPILYPKGHLHCDIIIFCWNTFRGWLYRSSVLLDSSVF